MADDAWGAGAGGTDLPTTLGGAVRQEFARIRRPPFETFVTVGVNGAIMSSAWFFLPTSLRDAVFTLHGSLAFALVLAAWMYSDVPATNVLGPDAARAVAAIDDPVVFRRLLTAKDLVLWSLVTPVCLVVAFVNGIFFAHDLLSALYAAIWIGIVPFGVLALSGLVGIRFPYHPVPIRYRWEHRRPWPRMVVRWAALVVTPYGLVPALGVVIMLPSLLLWGLTSTHGLSQKLPDRDLGWGVALACAVALACTVGGHRLGSWWATRRRDALVAYLTDPTRG